MKNSLLIGKKIKTILSSNSELNSKVNGQIYPLLANQSTKYPFIVYSRDSVTADYCKDGNFQDNVGVTIITVSDNYEESVDIANLVRESFELLTFKDDDIYIAESYLVSVTESTQEDAYIQRINFNLNIQ